ncbi:hypothetical protein [Streptomyces sp. NPDC088925]|uniref:hypothetical protein n=1 Tax=Streptomyces sp. NPDC088925 TaxID=3365914 RepID=UPI003815AB3A
MSRSQQALHRDLVAALGDKARRTGERAPSVRGSDWRLATVSAAGTDGTVVADGIRARCMPTYAAPAAGDVVVLDQSGSGSWLCWGPTAKATPAWAPIPLAANWSAASNYYPPTYRINGDGTASLSGLATMSGTLANAATVATLPAAARPAAQVRVAVQVATGFFGVMTLAPSGVVSLGDFSGTLSTSGAKWSEYDALSRYRLT